jgi:hypothetical protein
MSDQPSAPPSKNENEIVLQVEFSGVCRAIVGERHKTLSLPAGSNYRGLIRRLADQFPGLVGVVIAPSANDLLNANIISRNGEELIMPDMLDRCPENGDRLILLSIIVGG